MKRFLHPLLLIVCLSLFLVPTMLAEETLDVTVQENNWEAEFRDHLSFNLTAQSPSEITEVSLFYKVVGKLATSRNEAEFTPGQTIEAQFKIDQTVPTNYMPPGAEIEYWWKLEDATGAEFKTEPTRLLYLDNRYDWQTLDNERLTLYWYEGSDSFGQQLFERANLALDTLSTEVGISLEDPIKIFIYGDHNDLLSALSTTAQEWTGGVAYTTYGVVVIGVSPSQMEWGLRAMTHEMSHLVIHQATDNPYGDLPRWLDEGIAVFNEDKDQLVDDFRPVMERAIETNEVMTLRTLSSPFPADPLKANLAYGQSGEVVRFIINTYGTESMAHLLEIFSEGALYDEALQEALGTDTDGLDNAWRASAGLPPLPGTAGEAPPALADESPPTDQDPSAPVAEQETEAEVEPVATEPVEIAAPAAEESPAAALPCLAGLIPLIFLLGVTLIWRA